MSTSWLQAARQIPLVVVATKAWNMLFAVADWATATQKATEPEKPGPSWSDAWSTVKRHAVYKKYEKEFEAFTIDPSVPGFEDDEVVLQATAFLDAWTRRRWGLVAEFMPAALLPSYSKGEAARFAKDVFGQYEIKSWAISAVSRNQASTAEIRASVTTDDGTSEMRFRMVTWTADGNLAIPANDGASWRLAIWAPDTFFMDTA